MPACAWGMLTGIVLLNAARLTVFCLALRAHRKWHIPLADLEKLIRACFPHRSRGRAPRRTGRPHARSSVDELRAELPRNSTRRAR
jgi:hypothetical protein